MSSGRESKKQTTETTQQEGEDLILRRRTNTHPLSLSFSLFLSLVLSHLFVDKKVGQRTTHSHSQTVLFLHQKEAVSRDLLQMRVTGEESEAVSNVLTTEGTQEEEVDDKNGREKRGKKRNKRCNKTSEKREKRLTKREKIVREEGKRNRA